MPPSYVKPYVKRGKNDAADAAAICEAVTRPTMRFVPVKSAEQQSVLMLQQALRVIIAQMQDLQVRIKSLERELLVWHRTNRPSRLLETIPGIGVTTATAIAATVTDPRHFKSGRQLAAWLGLVPRQNSTGGKDRLGRISKMGDRYIRKLLVVGATALIRFARNRTTPLTAWADKLLTHRPARLVSVALANKMARIAWAVLSRGKPFNAAVA